MSLALSRPSVRHSRIIPHETAELDEGRAVAAPTLIRERFGRDAPTLRLLNFRQKFLHLAFSEPSAATVA